MRDRKTLYWTIMMERRKRRRGRKSIWISSLPEVKLPI
jgi:hypothetical protein